MKVAIVHDDLMQWGGAERVLVALTELFPDAPIYTSVYNDQNKLIWQHLKGRQIYTSFLQNIPGWKSLYKLLLPLYPIAFEQFDFSDFDLVISHTTRFAKYIITKPQTTHICYCHTPPRFLWNYSGDKVPKVLSFYLSFLRVFDQSASSRVDYWLAGSGNAKRRIDDVYKVNSRLVYPFVDLEKFKKFSSFDGGYLLVISRLVPYKRVDLIIKACNKLKIPLKIIGVGPKMAELKTLVIDLKAEGLVEFLGSLDENILMQVISGCKALVVAAEEDFGLTPLEAQAMGKPVVAYKDGGTVETVINGQTGLLFHEQTEVELAEAILGLDNMAWNKQKCLEQAEKFSKEIFKNKFMETLNNLI